MTDIRSGGRKERFSFCDPLIWIGLHLTSYVEALGKPIDLLDIELNVALEERNAPVFGFACCRVLFRTVDGLGIDNRRTLLPFPDGAAVFQSLLECHPGRRRKTTLHS